MGPRNRPFAAQVGLAYLAADSEVTMSDAMKKRLTDYASCAG